MPVLTTTIAGALILGIPLLLVAAVALRKQPRPILLFALALILVGLGYLGAVGALDDIGARVIGASAPVPAPAKP